MVALAQNAQLSGVVKDKTGAVVPQTEVTLTNTGTAAVLHSKTSKVGFFIFSSVQPGRYNLSAEAAGFDKTLIQNVKVDVAANVSLDMILQIRQGAEQITVTGNAQVNDTDGAISTVIGHDFIENMPLNGNDLQTLFELTPGTLLNGGGSEAGSQAYGGGFSVDGQRSTANYTTVDGASANAYVASNGGNNNLGFGIATSASGGTDGILPVDAIEEFRIDTSTYTAENGRTPGGQIQIRTRSGTNQFHGTLFENFRNQILDANDWFSNYDHIAQAQLRMNEYGGTLGGPVVIPHLFNGRNKLFFLVANQNLALDQPNTTSKLEVPDASLSTGAYPVFKTWLHVFPAGNGGPLSNIPSFDYFNHSYPDKIRDHTTSVRLDAQLPRSTHAFFRESIAPSSANEEANVSDLKGSIIDITTYTAGLTTPVGTRIINQLTGNYTTDNTQFQYTPPSLGGNDPTAVRNNLPAGVIPSSQEFEFEVSTPTFSASSVAVLGAAQRNQLHMWNVVDSLAVSVGKHNLKLGVDVLGRTTLLQNYSVDYDVLVKTAAMPPYSSDDLSEGIISDASVTNNVANPHIYSSDTSLFLNDSWNAAKSLTLNVGLRWELNPSPTVGPLGALAFSNDNSNLSTFTAAPSKNPLYPTVYNNFAPRFGFAWKPTRDADTVIRGGGGIYFDTGQAATEAGTVSAGYPYQYSQSYVEVPYASFDWTKLGGSATAQSLTNFYLVSPTLLSPRTYEWSLTLDQSVGKYSKLTMSYVGNDGEMLIGQNTYYNAKNSAGQYPFPTATVAPNGYFYLTTNQSHSNYQALQGQITSRLGQRLNALVSYTWEHAEDNGSNDFANVSASIPHNRLANSSIDIPQIFSTAVHYSPEGVVNNSILRAVTGGWSLDTIALLQSASPITVTAGNTTNEAIYGFSANASRIQGVPAVLSEHMNSGTVVPGSKLLNWYAFAAPPTNASGIPTSNGNSPTNGYRLFGLRQWDLGASRSWKLCEGMNLSFRADAFNLLNMPNFYAGLSGSWTSVNSSTFGRATSTYASQYGGSVAGDGANGAPLAVFQNGGPREVQLSIKLKF
jgi:hypothetical protein